MTQVLEKPQAPTLDPLTRRDRRIIATIIERTAEEVRTISIEGGITVWVQLVDGGRLAFCRDWFAKRVQEVKTSLPETISERNDRLNTELKQACKKFSLNHGQIDWLSFSTTLYLNNQRLGIVGYNSENKWYSQHNQLRPSYKVNRIDAALALLGVKQPVAA